MADSQVAVVTGAGSGIGCAVAKALAASGKTVWLVGRTREKLQQVASEIGSGAEICAADITSEADLRGLLKRLQSRAAGVDVLVHCAGVIVTGKLEEANIADLDSQYQVHLRGPYLLTQLLLPLLKAASGQVVFMNSSAGLVARSGSGQYSATFSALKAIAESLRAEVNQYGIRVLNVFPGRTATPRQEDLYRKSGAEYRPALLMQPEDVATMVMAALNLARTAEVTEISMRPLLKSY